MIYIQFLIGLIIYLFMAFASYYDALKQSKYYFPLGILAAIIANFIWLSIAKSETNSSALVIKGVLWDLMLTLCYVAVPILFFKTQFTVNQIIGILLMLVGLIFIKL